MKLARYGAAGQEKPALVDAAGRLRDLSGHVEDIAGEVLSPGSLARLARLDPDTLPPVEGDVRLGAPVGRVGKFIGVGLNYSDHAAEAGMKLPKDPILFSKATSSIAGPNDDVLLPDYALKADWEVELAVVIGTPARQVSAARALEYVAGYCVCNDLSERAFQLETSGQWLKGKGLDGFGPLGPYLVTPDEAGDVQALDLFLDLNGERTQTGNTSRMVFSVAEIIAETSRYMTLLPGDVITTGTPPGVGMGRKPQRFLRPGDEMRLGVAGLGEQRQRVVRRED
ncbi:MAG: 2-hydroxyhepta-2,4-diene-1,7-dioate isomerase [Hyphomicrobiales bacterium]|nr:MAG: 2-hydroxyhepta-2,4-diene-1,7-dioate isomerase [Hyphomicrobiales bacterium]